MRAVDPSRSFAPSMPARLARRAARTGIALALVLAGSGCALFEPKPAWKQPPPPPAEGPVVAADALHRATLANGLQVIVLEDRRLPRISAGFTLRRGAGSVPPAQAGLAELAMEVIQRGAGDRDALALARIVEDAGASLSASAGWDTTSVALAGLSEDRDLLFEILEDVALRPRFEASEFEKARSEQAASIVAAQDEPATLVTWHALRVLYAGHRYGLPDVGTAETLASLDAAAARAYWTDRFVPRNAIFWAVGDLEAASVIAEAERRFGAMPDRPPIADTPPPPSQTPPARRIVIVDKPELGQARILIAHEGIARTEPERIPIELMNDALGGSGFSSRLMKSVRGEEGLTYGIGSGFSLRRHPGPYSIATFTRVPEVRRVLDIIFDEVRGIQGDRPVSETELENFVRYNVGSFGLSLETSDAVLGALVDLMVYGLPDDSLDTYRHRVRAVTLEEVRRAAQTRLHPDRAAIVLLGPAEALVPQVEDLGTVEVWEP
ncbi:MAG TPA: pitrilysin family protein [Myxococcota bacterium]|nr:pitrilysin family protein [Myxococcota bacterium]